ncbi:MAG: hypothetical protein QOD75_2699 [Blastocatellia bacterium]|jgi:hypothetical protein|nr:hypothetical protein [Blastocatellia bacterium]
MQRVNHGHALTVGAALRGRTPSSFYSLDFPSAPKGVATECHPYQAAARQELRLDSRIKRVYNPVRGVSLRSAL